MMIPRQASQGYLVSLRRIRWLIAYWGMVLSAVGAFAGARVTGGAPQSMSLQGMRWPALGGTPDALETSTVQAVAGPHAGLAAAAIPRQVELADPHLASTALKREQLTYLVRCALPEDVELYTQQGAERFTFPGRMGLAPRWESEAMTPIEERWVSACLLAHVNYFGRHVTVSMRATPPPVPALQASEEEHQAFSIFEGGFFGNLFSPHPMAYTCLGARTPEQTHDPVLQDRVCTQATDARTAAGLPVTPCRFILTGRCEDTSSLTVDGEPYTEVVFTYLRPGQRP